MEFTDFVNFYTGEFGGEPSSPLRMCDIQLHSSPNTLPYSIVNSDETFGVFNVVVDTLPVREGPFHFLFTIDATLSMTETDVGGITKIQYMKETLVKMLKYLETLDPTIYVTVYTFNTESTMLVNKILLTKESVTFMEEIVKMIEPENSTNIQIALETANTVIENIKNEFPEHQLAHIFMTDGEANVGKTDADELATLINPSFPNVFIGFGKNHNSKMLNRFAECKNSEYYFVDNLENSVLVYAESIHNILYGAFYEVEFHISNGELYDYQKNQWTQVLYENVLSSESNKFYQLKTRNPKDVEVHIISGNRVIDVASPLPDLYDEEDGVLNRTVLTDLTKYAYRNKVQELLFLVKELTDSSKNMFSPDFDIESNDFMEKTTNKLSGEIHTVFNDIRNYMRDNELLNDPLLRLLCEDLYITNKTLDMGIETTAMYACARQTSQGKHRSYNVGSSLPDTVSYDCRPRLVRSTNHPDDFHNYCLEGSTATCFASPTMINTFREVSESF